MVHMADLLHTTLTLPDTDRCAGFIADQIPDSLRDHIRFVAVAANGEDLCEPHTEFQGRDEQAFTAIVVTHRRPECGPRTYSFRVCDCCLATFLRDLRRDGADDITVLVPAGYDDSELVSA